MSLMNEIHRNQINVEQLIIVFDTIKRVIFSSTLSSDFRRRRPRKGI